MSRDIWFISDTHFGHANIIEYCRPQFSSVEEMDQALIDNWNVTVKPNDLVYHLGDFAWKPTHAFIIRPMLNGSIRLIVGNHDDIPALCLSGHFQRVEMWRVFKDFNFTASHVPMRKENIRHGNFNVHGHVHNDSASLEDYHINVSVENIGYKPVHLDEILVKTKPENPYD